MVGDNNDNELGMASGVVDREDTNADGREDRASVSQTLRDGRVVTVTRSDRNHNGEVDYYFIDVYQPPNQDYPNGARFRKELSVDDIAAWNQVDSTRLAIRNAFVRAPEWTWDRLFDGGLAFTQREADFLADTFLSDVYRVDETTPLSDQVRAGPIRTPDRTGGGQTP